MVNSELKLIDAQVHSDFLLDYDKKEALKSDFKLVIGSIAILFLCLAVGLSSLRLALIVMILSLLSQGASFCISRGVFGVKYATYEMLVLEILTVICVTSSYVYLLADAWVQSTNFSSLYREKDGK